MKALLYIIFFGSLISVIYGFSIEDPSDRTGAQFIGAGVVGFFFGWMPLFIYHRYKNRDFKKYMITDQTINKIKDEAETFLD